MGHSGTKLKCSLTSQTNTLITGGENGLITIWSIGAVAETKTNVNKASNLKEKTYKKHKSVPY